MYLGRLFKTLVFRMGPLAACLASVRLLEGTFESIIQLIILLSYISFWKIYFSGSRGDITFSAYD